MWWNVITKFTKTYYVRNFGDTSRISRHGGWRVGGVRGDAVARGSQSTGGCGTLTDQTPSALELLLHVIH